MGSMSSQSLRDCPPSLSVLPPTFVCDSGVLATRLIVACRLGYEPNLTRSKQAPDSSRTSRPSSAEWVGGRDRKKASLSLSRER
jgi:hypothetical protein